MSHLPDEWGVTSPLTSVTSRDLDRTDLAPGNQLLCTRTAAQDFKIFPFGAFTEANVKPFSFFCKMHFSGEKSA